MADAVDAEKKQPERKNGEKRERKDGENGEKRERKDGEKRERKDGERRERKEDEGPLVKPEPVADPNESGHLERTAKIKEAIDAGEKKVLEINEEMEKYKGQRSEHDVRIKEVRAELMAQKDKFRECAREKDVIVEELKRMSEVIKNHFMRPLSSSHAASPEIPNASTSRAVSGLRV